MTSRIIVCLVLVTVMLLPLSGCAKKVYVHDIGIPPTPIEKAPVSVRAAEAREKKVYDFKQHYMKPEAAAPAASGSVQSHEPAKTVKPKIAVSRFGDTKNLAINPFSAFIGETVLDRDTNTQITTNFDKEAYEGFTEDIISSLVALEKFIVVERKEINKIIREQGFQGGVLSDNLPNKDFGAITGVDYIVTGSVTEDEAKNVIVNLRVYDVFRGVIVGAERIAAPSKWEAVNRAVEKIAEEVKPKEWVLKVSNAVGQTVYVNGGSSQNVQGGHYEVFSVGNPIVDPDTNEVLGVEEERIALISLSGIQPSYSIGTIVEQTRPIKTGDIVRPYQGVFFNGDTAKE